MCRNRTASSLCILHLRLVQHLLAEIAAQILGRAEVHFSSPEQGRQLTLHARDPEKPRDLPWLKLNEQINIAVGAEIRPQRRAKDCQTPDVALSAE